MNQDRFDVYRVRQSTTHPKRHVRKAWYGRTWQADLHENNVWSPRAYTRWGVVRKARRWQQRSLEDRLISSWRRQWWRAHVTRRRDPFYVEHRKRLGWRIIPQESEAG